MKKDPGAKQQSQSAQERPQSPQPNFEPEQAESEIREEDIAKRAYALYEQRGGFPGAELDDWLQAEQELRNRKKDRAA